jgi:membrane-bound serine protease (ClpP class)
MITEALMPGIIIGLIGTAALVVSVIYGFQYSTGFGIAQIVFAAVVVPMVFYWSFRHLALKKSLVVQEGAISFAQSYEHLLNKSGKALTPLRPAGIILVEGKKYDVVTEGDMIAKGSEVKVIKVEGNKIYVKAIHRDNV